MIEKVLAQESAFCPKLQTVGYNTLPNSSSLCPNLKLVRVLILLYLDRMPRLLGQATSTYSHQSPFFHPGFARRKQRTSLLSNLEFL